MKMMTHTSNHGSRMLYDEATGTAPTGGDAGGQNSGDASGQPQGSGSFLQQGNAGGQQSGTGVAATNGTPQSDPGQQAAAPSGQSAPDLTLEGLKGQLPPEVANDTSIMSYNTVPDALTALQQARKSMAMDPARAVELPSDPGNFESLRQFATNLGLPASADDMKLEQPKDAQGNPVQGMEPDHQLAKGFTSKAHELGILPQQAQQLYGWFAEQTQSLGQQSQQQTQENLQAAQQELQQEWGEAYQTKLSDARVAAERLGGQELIQTLEQTGAANSPVVIKALAQMAGMVSEDKGATPDVQGGGSGSRTPAQLREEAGRMEKEAMTMRSSRDRGTMLQQARDLRDRAGKFG